MANPTAELNPQILSDLTTLTREFLTDKQCRYLSARMVWEFYRATRTRRIAGDGEFRLNNNALPLYARAVMLEPDLRGVFRTRRARLDEPGYDDLDDGVSDRERAEMRDLDTDWNLEDDQ